MSVTMLSRYGERRLTTAPSRTYGMAPRVSTAPRASDYGTAQTRQIETTAEECFGTGSGARPLRVAVSKGNTVSPLGARPAAMSFSGVREERLKTPLPKASPPRSDAPSPAKSVLRSPSFEAPNALDAQFSALVHDIQQRLSLLARGPTIRVEKWLRKLHDPVSNVTWKRLRNDYARLLRHNLRLGATSPPFDRAPGDGPLRNLLPDEKARFRGDGFGVRTPTEGRVDLGANDTERKARAKAIREKTRRERTSSSAKVDDSAKADDSAEAALRDLLRRAEVAGAPRAMGAAEIATAVPKPLRGLFENEHENPFLDVDRVANGGGTDDDDARLGPSARSEAPASRAEMRAFIAAEGASARNRTDTSTRLSRTRAPRRRRRRRARGGAREVQGARVAFAARGDGAGDVPRGATGDAPRRQRRARREG